MFEDGAETRGTGGRRAAAGREGREPTLSEMMTPMVASFASAISNAMNCAPNHMQQKQTRRSGDYRALLS